jgi:hypothetical protein
MLKVKGMGIRCMSGGGSNPGSEDDSLTVKKKEPLGAPCRSLNRNHGQRSNLKTRQYGISLVAVTTQSKRIYLPI